MHLQSLESKSFFDLDKLKRLQLLGAKEVWLPGTNVVDSAANCEYAQKYKLAGLTVRPFVGTHPCESGTFIENQWIDFLDENKTMVSGIGEIGLHKNVSLQDQFKSLEFFLDYAYEYQLPILIHCVNMHNELLQLFKTRKSCLPRGVIHCANLGLPQATVYLKHGFLLGIGGVYSYQQNTMKITKMYKLVNALPLASFVTETDYPYTSWQPLDQEVRSFTPFDLPSFISMIAYDLKKDVEEVAQILVNNAQSIF